MSHLAFAEASAGPADFARFLASLAALDEQPRSAPTDEAPLEDDVAALSYETALRSHRRVPSGIPAPAFTASGVTVPGAKATKSPEPRPVAPARSSDAAAGTAQDRKTASLTIRLSARECAQLRERAAEAGMSLSAYMRSCALEVESLRSQVKQTLAGLRESQPPVRSGTVNTTPPMAGSSARGVWLLWLKKLLRRRRVRTAGIIAPAAF